MIFSEKLQIIRKSHGMTQEDLANKMQVSRQAVAKWENGMSYPDIMNLIEMSKIFHVSIDYLVKDEECDLSPKKSEWNEREQLISFRIKAIRNTYAGHADEVAPSRLSSHDYTFEEGDYKYMDTWLGGEKFSGEEAVWKGNLPVYSMNYFGRVLQEEFSGDFLKEALRAVTSDLPFRGPEYFESGEYIYKTKVVGDIEWFQGYEEIYYNKKKVYECFYHGGLLV